MEYKRGNFGISVSQIDGFGKRPSLWVFNKDCYCKVASFGSEEQATAFLYFLDWIVFGRVKPE